MGITVGAILGLGVLLGLFSAMFLIIITFELAYKCYCREEPEIDISGKVREVLTQNLGQWKPPPKTPVDIERELEEQHIEKVYNQPDWAKDEVYK